MSLIPTVYSSADPGAPQLTGLQGSLVALLNAVLVDGYGVGANAKAGLGWTREFTAANKAVFKNSAIYGTGAYLRVLDDGSGPGSGRTARVNAYSSMTSIDAGIGKTPSDVEQSVGSLVFKSATTDGTSRIWWAIGTETAIYLFTGWYNATYGAHSPYFFGDIVSDAPADGGRFMVSAAPIITTFGGEFTARAASLFICTGAGAARPPTNGTGAGSFMLLGYQGGDANRACGGVWPSIIRGNVGTLDLGTYGPPAGVVSGTLAPYPDPVTGGYRYCDCIVGHGGGVLRGRLPGVFGSLHAQSAFENFQVIPGSADLPAGAMLVVKHYQSSDFSGGGYAGSVFFVTGVPWQ